MATYNQLRKAINLAKKRQDDAREAMDAAAKALLEILPDADLFPSEAENADNIYEAMMCYANYGEYDVESIIKEVKEAVRAREMLAKNSQL